MIMTDSCGTVRYYYFRMYVPTTTWPHQREPTGTQHCTQFRHCFLARSIECHGGGHRGRGRRPGPPQVGGCCWHRC